MDAIRFGRAIRALRRRQRLTQRVLGERSGLSQSEVSRIEAGKVGRVGFAQLRALGMAMGAEVELNVRWHGEGLDRLLDEGHAATVEEAVRLLRAFGWRRRSR